MPLFAKRAAVFLAAAATASTFFINFCHLVFQCGCRSLWAGAAESCNIHQAHGRHCPWCASDPTWAYVVILGAQALCAFWPGRLGWRVRLLLALIAFPVAGGLAALAYGLKAGYWNV